MYSGTTDSLLAMAWTTLSVIVLVISLIMGLKFRWFRTRVYNIQAFKGTREPKGSSEPRAFVGVYRGQSFEVASAAPSVYRPGNATAGSSSHTFQQPTLTSKQEPPPSSSDYKFKTVSKKNYPASSSENPPVGQSQPSGSKQDKKDRNKSKYQSATPKNPLARSDEHNERLRAVKPPQGTGQNTRPKNKAPVPKSIVHTKLPPIPVAHDGNSSLPKLNDGNHTSHKLTNDNRTYPRDIDDNYVSHEPVHGDSRAPKSKMPIPKYVSEQDESESEI
jgi:hypothetical protein